LTGSLVPVRVAASGEVSKMAKGMKAKKAFDDRRISPRLEVKLKVDLRTKYVYTTASVLNVSSTGMFIKTTKPLPVGSEVEIVLHMPDQQEPYQLKGVVRWGQDKHIGSIPPGMGVQLVEKNKKLLKLLVEIIQNTPKNI
jgi:type IV pilus assembly protein PilZ